jgi:plastocyanin
MKRNACVLMVVFTGLSMVAWAGDISGKVTGMNGKSVVYVDGIAGKTFPAPADHPVVNQKGLMFLPHVTVIQQGATVEFLNSDNVAHNAFWSSIGGDKKAGHNLGTWPKGEKRPFTFTKPGVVPVLCNVHPEMTAFVIVSPTPYFAETDESGNYSIKGVPDGTYTVTAWHEGARNQSKPVTVSGGAKIDFTITK